MQNKLTRFLRLVVALTTMVGGMSVSSDELVSVDQRITTADEKIFVTVRVKNNLSRSIFVEQLPDTRDRTLGQWFFLKSREQEIPFIGAMAKRKPYDKKDFFELQPKSQQEQKIRLDLDYEFLDGNNEYQISYLYLTYDEKSEKVLTNTSGLVTFSYNKISKRIK